MKKFNIIYFFVKINDKYNMEIFAFNFCNFVVVFYFYINKSRNMTYVIIV